MDVEYDPTLTERVLFAPEGFLDSRYLPILEHDDINIIELRVLADGPVFHTIQNRLVRRLF